MRERPDWMSNTDLLILLALNSSDMIRVFSPTIIAYNLGVSRAHASRRLTELSAKGFVEIIEEGRYQLSNKGRAYLNGNLDVSDIDTD